MYTVWVTSYYYFSISYTIIAQCIFNVQGHRNDRCISTDTTDAMHAHIMINLLFHKILLVIKAALQHYIHDTKHDDENFWPHVPIYSSFHLQATTTYPYACSLPKVCLESIYTYMYNKMYILRAYCQQSFKYTSTKCTHSIDRVVFFNCYTHVH